MSILVIEPAAAMVYAAEAPMEASTEGQYSLYARDFEAGVAGWGPTTGGEGETRKGPWREHPFHDSHLVLLHWISRVSPGLGYGQARDRERIEGKGPNRVWHQCGG